MFLARFLLGGSLILDSIRAVFYCGYDTPQLPVVAQSARVGALPSNSALAVAQRPALATNRTV
jgi:hypothetical protein